MKIHTICIIYPEAEFSDVTGTKVSRVFLLAIHSHPLLKDFPPPPPPFPLEQSLKLVCNLNIVYGNLKTENFQDNSQKPQRNCTLMNSVSGLRIRILSILFGNKEPDQILHRKYKIITCHECIFQSFCKEILGKYLTVIFYNCYNKM
jgi:hypothetical protein